MVIGGGEVAQRKVLRLLDCGASVIVVSKIVTPLLQNLREQRRLRHIEAEYEAGQLDGIFLAIGATDHNAVNEQIFMDCRRKGVLVNIVDDPARCDFILPSLCEHGDLSIAVSTGGKSPALAKKIRTELEACYGPEYALLLDLLGEIRQKVIAVGRSSDENREVFEALVQSPILEELRAKRWDKVENLVETITGLDMNLSEGGLPRWK